MTRFSSDEYMPADWSFVVWAQNEAVDIKAQSEESDHFPTYKLSDTVKVYDLKGNQIENPGNTSSGGNNSGGGSSGGGSTDYDQGDNTDRNDDNKDDDLEPYIPFEYDYNPSECKAC